MNDKREQLRLVLMFHISFCDSKILSYKYVTVDENGEVWVWCNVPRFKNNAHKNKYWMGNSFSEKGLPIIINGIRLKVDRLGVNSFDALFLMKEIFEQD